MSSVFQMNLKDCCRQSEKSKSEVCFAYCLVILVFLVAGRFGRIYLLYHLDDIIIQFIGICGDHVCVSLFYLSFHQIPRVISFIASNLLCLVVLVDLASFVITGAPLTVSGVLLLLDHFSIIIINIDMLQLLPAIAILLVILSIPLILKYVASQNLPFRLMIVKHNKTVCLLICLLYILCSIFFSQFPTENVIIRLFSTVVISFNPFAINSHKLVSSELKYLRQKEEILVEFHRENIEATLTSKSAVQPSLFVIVLESIRASSLPIYNKDVPSELTPFLSELIESGEGQLVKNFHSSMPNTMKTLYAAMCGLLPHPSVQWHEYESSPYLKYCLPSLLNKLGYVTRFYTSSMVGYQPRLGFTSSFGGTELDIIQKLKKARKKKTGSNHVHAGEDAYGRISRLGFDERVMVQPTSDWLTSEWDKDQSKGKPCFGVFGALSTHAPYTTYNQTRRSHIKPLVDKMAASSASPSNFAAYLAAIHDTDDWLREMVSVISLSDQIQVNGGVIVIVGDHGEGFGEHPGNNFHGGGIYEESIHIPLIVIDKRRHSIPPASSSSSSPTSSSSFSSTPPPSSTSSTRIHDQHVFSSIDLYETFLGFLGYNSDELNERFLTKQVVRPHTLPPSRNIFNKTNHDKTYSECEVVVLSLMDEQNMACLTVQSPALTHHQPKMQNNASLFLKERKSVIYKLIKGGEQQQFKTELFNLEHDPHELHGASIQVNRNFFNQQRNAFSFSFMNEKSPQVEADSQEKYTFLNENSKKLPLVGKGIDNNEARKEAEFELNEAVGSLKWVKKSLAHLKSQRLIASLRHESDYGKSHQNFVQEEDEIGCHTKNQECCFVHVGGSCPALPQVVGLGWFEGEVSSSSSEQTLEPQFHQITLDGCLSQKLHWESLCGETSKVDYKVGLKTQVLSVEDIKLTNQQNKEFQMLRKAATKNANRGD